MKNVLTICGFMVAIVMSGQNNVLQIKQGTKLDFEVTQYPLAMEINSKWLKMKDEKRAEEAVSISQDIAGGKIKPKAKSSVTYSILEEKTEGDKTIYKGLMEMGATKFKVKVEAKGDTTSFYLNDGPYPVVARGDTLGVAYYGERKFPMKPQTGTFFPAYVNDTYLVPSEFTSAVKKTFFVTSGNYNYYGFVTDKKKVKITTNTIQIYQPFYVASIEDFTVSGKTFKAYKLRNSVWFKINSNATEIEDANKYFDNASLNKEIKNQLEKFDEIGAKISRRAINKMTGANAEGYIESIEENWYVPELGFYVKTVHYDKDGIIQFITEIKSIH
jgi:hypothetical protein